jgi:asparagine synthase (glutamine-hydrolysing)
MCGIFGIINNNQKHKFEPGVIKSAVSKMRHRGPNAEVIIEIDKDVTFAHLRLSIIDLSPENNQPFQIDDRYWIVFNGEIYNFIEIRQELITLGYSFRTDGDTEVLLRSYVGFCNL